MALAAFAAGADGLMIEVHPDPENALSDGAQSLTPAGFADLMGRSAVSLSHLIVRSRQPRHQRGPEPGVG